MKKISITVLCLFISFAMVCQTVETSNKIENLKTFAKAYGYVKYFHPSDEAADIDWNKFAIYGSEKVEKCVTKEELLQTLDGLFHPIAPTVKFSRTEENTKF